MLKEWEKSLSDLTGKKIVDVAGMIVNEWGDPMVKLTRILFEDGTSMGVEGEHDMPYLCTADETFIERVAALYDARGPRADVR